MDDRITMILLRLVHILAGLFWVGAAIVVNGFLLPALRETGPAGGRFMQVVMQQRRLGIYMLVAMVLTVLSGFVMFGRFVSAANGAGIQTPFGMALGIGALTALLAAGFGVAIAVSSSGRMAKLAAEVYTRPGEPDAGKVAELGAVQRRLAIMGRVVIVLLVLATAAMATARYL